jgi:hypothetical protein
MRTQPRVLEGMWEEIQKHSERLARRRVRVVILPARRPSAGRKRCVQSKAQPSAKSVEECFGSWVGNDFETCLQEVYATRSKARF